MARVLGVGWMLFIWFGGCLGFDCLGVVALDLDLLFGLVLLLLITWFWIRVVYVWDYGLLLVCYSWFACLFCTLIVACEFNSVG